MLSEEPKTAGAGDSGNEGPLNLTELEQLLVLLTKYNVLGFTGGGVAVTFMAPTAADADDEESVPLNGRPAEIVRVDEDRSTSSRQVVGFHKHTDVWHNPSLWPSQAGKVLKLDGSLE